MRLARLHILKERDVFSESLSQHAIGLNCAVAEQVAGEAFLLPDNNIPMEGVDIQTLSLNPEEKTLDPPQLDCERD